MAVAKAAQPSRQVERIAVTIRLDLDADIAADAVLRRLKRAGVTDMEVHQRLRMVSGTVPRHRLAEVEAVEGVASARADTVYRPMSK
jgi:D-serine deaminase-like pyridoxal phosphate-dependent protein